MGEFVGSPSSDQMLEENTVSLVAEGDSRLHDREALTAPDGSASSWPGT